METTDRIRSPSPKRLLHFLHRAFFECGERVTDPEKRQQASLLAIFTFILMIMTILVAALPLGMKPAGPGPGPFPYFMAATTLALLIAYILSRGRHFLTGAWIAVIAMTVIPYSLALILGDIETTQLTVTMSWLTIALIMGSIFLGVEGVIILIAANVLALILSTSLLPQIQSTTLLGPVVLFFLTGILLLVGTFNRNRQETHRLAEFAEKNLELELMRNSLEASVESRTADLQKRLTQLRTAAEISRSISTILDPDQLFSRVVSAVRDGFSLYYVGVFLLDDNRTYAYLKEGSGEAGSQMVAEGHRLLVGGASMIGWAISHKKPRIALDVGAEAVHFNNPHLPDTRSEMALPLLSGDEVVGALSIQSAEPLAFDDDDIAVLEGIASSLASSIRNANLYQQLQENLESIQSYTSGYLDQAWSSDQFDAEKTTIRIDQIPEEDNQFDLNKLDIPLTLRKQVIGQLTVETEKTGWTADEQAFIDAITNQAAVALENARLLEETRRRVEQERIVSEIVGKLYGTTDVNHVLRTGLQELSLALNASEGIVQFGPQIDPAQD